MELPTSNTCINECKALCCKYTLSSIILFHDKYSRDYWEARAQKRIKLSNGYLYLFESRCPQLDEDNKCKLHDDKKPEFCRDYPSKDTHPHWKYICKLLQNKSKGQ